MWYEKLVIRGFFFRHKQRLVLQEGIMNGPSSEISLLETFERNGFKRLKGESDADAAVRLFREQWPRGGEALLDVLSSCCHIPPEEVATLADGTLWLSDEPGISPPPEESAIKGRDRFLALLQAVTRPAPLP